MRVWKSSWNYKNDACKENQNSFIKQQQLQYKQDKYYNGPRVVKFISAKSKKFWVKNDFWTKKNAWIMYN